MAKNDEKVGFDDVEGEKEPPVVFDRILTDAQIDEFIENGVLVVPNLITQEEIDKTRQDFHDELRKYGVDHEDLDATGHNLSKLSSTGGAGGILDLFYPSWRLRMAENDKIFAAMTDLWRATYADEQNTLFPHPHGSFNPKQGYMYINRVCYRLPDRLSKKFKGKKSKPLQRSLTPHLDCCPNNLYDSGKDKPRWRPIQCITALTANDAPSTGGFEAVPGFHKKFSTYYSNRNDDEGIRENTTDDKRPAVCVGDFSPLTMQDDRELIGNFKHINYKAGDVVFWDWRIPHANSYRHVGSCPREVIYTGFLPKVPTNESYAEEQLYRYQRRLLPADHWQKGKAADVDEIFSAHHFSSLGSRLIGLYDW